MHFSNILQEIEKTDPAIFDRLDTRRKALKKFGGFTGKLALSALPLAIGSLLNKAYGSPPPSSVTDILNYALTLEYLEAGFYARGIAAGKALIPTTAELQAINTIGAHEAEHVSFLQTAIRSLGATPVSQPTFDYSAGAGSGSGPFADVFTNYQTFLAVAQTFEDTGVRAYKGQAGYIVKGGDLLTAALNIHSVEARHASHIRQMRKANGFANVKPWITGNQSGIGPIVQASYDGEENTVQATLQIVHINGYQISADAASEAFDEPLTMDQVLAIVKPFFAA